MRSKELVGQMSLQNHLLGDYTLHMPGSSNHKEKHSIEFETRFEIETRIIIIKVLLIHPIQKLSGNTHNHQCHTHKVGRQAGRCYRIDNMLVKREVNIVKYCNYYHECNIKENERCFIWVGGQLWNHISKQIINGHFIFPNYLVF